MLDLETALRRFFASAPQNVRAVQTLEFSHSAFSRTWRIWPEPYAGAITTEAGVVAVEPADVSVTLAGVEGHLDQTYRIVLNIVGETFRDELDAVPIDTTEKIVIIYREYLSDDLTAAQASVTLQAEAVVLTLGAATITAATPRYNSRRTGETYNPKLIPMLRGFL